MPQTGVPVAGCPQRVLEPAELYKGNVAPDTHQCTVNLTPHGGKIRYHSESEDLRDARECLVRTTGALLNMLPVLQVRPRPQEPTGDGAPYAGVTPGER